MAGLHLSYLVAIWLQVLAVVSCSILANSTLLTHNQAYSKPSLVKRAEPAKAFEIPFYITINHGEVYSFNCSIGTPPQKIQLGISVYRSDPQISMNVTRNSWPTIYNSTLSTSANRLLESSKLGSNSTVDFLGPTASVNGADVVDVFYASDSLTISSLSNTTATLKDMPFVAFSLTTLRNARLNTGRFDTYDSNWIGLGLSSGQAIVQLTMVQKGGRPYPTFAQHFISGNLIESNSYSLWLNPISSKSGYLLLGGIDSSRFKGNLTSLATKSNTTSDVYGLRFQDVLTCSLEFISVRSTPIPSSNIPHVALAHSVNTILEAGVAKALWDAVGATYDVRDRLFEVTPQVPCSYLTNSSTIDFKFSGTTFVLSVPMSYITTRGENSHLDGFTPLDACILRIKAAYAGMPSMLGTGVMRNLYTAYDLENNILSIALTDFEATNRTKNIIAIPKAGVAAITKEAFEGKPNITDNVVSNTTTNPDSSKPPNSSSTGVQGAEKGTNSVAIGVGVAVPVVVIIVLVVGFLLFRRRKQKKEEAARTAAEQYNKPELEDNSKVMGTQAGLERTVNGEVDGNPVHEMHDVSGVVHEMPANVPRQELA